MGKQIKNRNIENLKLSFVVVSHFYKSFLQIAKLEVTTTWNIFYTLSEAWGF